MKVLVSQSCPTHWNPMNCSLSGSSVHGILQAGILEWVAIPFSMGSSRPRDWTWVFCIAGRFFTIWATREAQHNDKHDCISFLFKELHRFFKKICLGVYDYFSLNGKVRLIYFSFFHFRKDVLHKTTFTGEEPRWRRSRMGRTLSPPQIHQKSI